MLRKELEWIRSIFCTKDPVSLEVSIFVISSSKFHHFYVRSILLNFGHFHRDNSMFLLEQSNFSLIYVNE